MAQKCVDLLAPMIQYVVNGAWDEVKAISKEIYHFEQEADNIKNDIRNHLPKSLFMPVDRRDLLDILHSIDAIADTVEDVAASLQLKPLQLPTELAESLLDLTAQAVGTARQAGHIVDEMDMIVQASFSGPEAEKVLRMIEEAGRLEHITDIAQQRFVRRTLELEDSLKPLDIMLWLKVSQEIGNLANNAERVADKLRLLISK